MSTAAGPGTGPGTGPATGVVTVGWSRSERVLIWGGFTLLGAGAGWLLPHLVEWLRGLPFGPFEWVAGLVDRAPAELVTPVAVVLGAVIGASLAGIGDYEALKVRLSADEVTLRHKDVSTTISRRDVAHVFVDGKRLVLLDPDGREQAGEGFDTSAARLAEAFERLGYPWRRDGDPYAADYRRWVPGMPGLPPSAGPLMVARQRALERDDKDEARLLRAELGGAGVVVRDEKGKQQHWRAVSPPRGGRPLRG